VVIADLGEGRRRLHDDVEVVAQRAIVQIERDRLPIAGDDNGVNSRGTTINGADDAGYGFTRGQPRRIVDPVQSAVANYLEFAS
jgi:hypothetical protein